MEHEIALALPKDAHDALHHILLRHPQIQFERCTQLLNVYLDTPTHDLKQQKAAFRLRFDTERLCWIQTLKTAGQLVNGVHSRNEWESTLPHATAKADVIPDIDLTQLPAEARILLSPLMTVLRPVFHTDFKREIYQYRQGDDVFEIAFDYGQVRLAEDNLHSTAVSLINELEIEYKAGHIDHMRQLANDMQNQLKATPQHISKAARGYMLMSQP
ncbi:CYTH domain-containing protein [Hydromonas duriensis]|uniref:Adenylate cyclase n=1 Tax=Hydromonas duriensis TaxID=1527608 RepID=A0A4R6YBJ2_9BURK|nr:CYTH domain-containing protein [Hydromonas duriensis]TDR33047.1 adenylate cyclase [Hydromonas duriensis]